MQKNLEYFGIRFPKIIILKNKFPKTKQLTLDEINEVATQTLKKFIQNRKNI